MTKRYTNILTNQMIASRSDVIISVTSPHRNFSSPILKREGASIDRKS